MKKYKTILNICRITVIVFLLVLFILATLNSSPDGIFISKNTGSMEFTIGNFFIALIAISYYIWPIYIILLFIMIYCKKKIYNLKKEGKNEYE